MNKTMIEQGEFITLMLNKEKDISS